MKTRRYSLQCEALEDRRLLSIGLGKLGVLSVIGTNSAERITIEAQNLILGHTLTQTSTGAYVLTPIYEAGIKATRSDMAGNVLETESFSAWQVGSVSITARGGSDVIRNNTDLPSDISAGSGRDSVHGGSGRDVIHGGSNDDQLFGNGGADELTGSSGNDSLVGGSGPDVLRGGFGHDSLAGGTGRDCLYGNAGNDSLIGGTNNDGLLGGDGLDTACGGGGSDRFLALKDEEFLFVKYDPDLIVDLQANDARINFEHGGGDNSNGVQYGGASWSRAELEQVDEAFALLHERTGNTKLLKKSDGGEMNFIRQGGPVGDVDSGTGGWNSGGDITLVELTFDADLVVQHTLHEIGHNWDDNNPEWEAFKALSGWKGFFWFWESKDSYVEAEDGWYYLTSRDDEFVSQYARANPKEDFAESFAAYFMDYGGMAHDFELAEGSDKLDLIHAWLNTID